MRNLVNLIDIEILKDLCANKDTTIFDYLPYLNGGDCDGDIFTDLKTNKRYCINCRENYIEEII